MSQALVGIIMGSDSDLAVMSEAADVLAELGITSEVRVISAHRTPEKAHEYAKTAEARGLKVIIAGAGGAAHLAGVTAANTALPVIGVPVKAKTLDGLDSLLSTVQMPPGIPVATIGINAAKNAGLFAAKIIATSDAAVMKKLVAYQEDLKKSVSEKDEKLQKIGYKAYLEAK